jgi:hypothetical protein
MKFARIVFLIAGIWSFIVTLPLYFAYGFIGHRSPPAITHPEFYLGLVGVTLAWQLAFLLIGADPVRFQPMMIPSIGEKLSYVLSIAALLVSRRISASQAAQSVPRPDPAPAIHRIVLQGQAVMSWERALPHSTMQSSPDFRCCGGYGVNRGSGTHGMAAVRAN